LAMDGQRVSGVVSRMIARVEEELVYVREARTGGDPGIRGAHAEGIDAAVLRDRGRGQRSRGDDHDEPAPEQPRAHQRVARFFQKRSRLSSPPNSVVKMVESASRMSPARSPAGGIHRNMLNSLFPCSMKGCGRLRSMGWRASTRMALVSSVVTA